MTTFLNLLLKHIVVFENFVKSITSCLLKLKVTPSFCFTFKIPDDPTASSTYVLKVLEPTLLNKARFTR